MNLTQATAVTPVEPTTPVPSMTFGHSTHMLAPATKCETRVGRYVLDRIMDPSTGDRSTPNPAG